MRNDKKTTHINRPILPHFYNIAIFSESRFVINQKNSLHFWGSKNDIFEAVNDFKNV